MSNYTVFFVIVFPRPWPMPAKTRLAHTSFPDSALDIYANTDGTLSALHGGKEHVFQSISITGSGKAILVAQCWPNKVQLRLNGTSLLAADQTPEPYRLDDTESPPTSDFPFSISAPRPGLSDAEELFVETLRDLQQRMVEGRRYDLIRSAGLLRQLLLDSPALVHSANRTHRLKITFDIPAPETHPFAPHVHWRSVDIQHLNPQLIVHATLPTFLRTAVLKIEQQVFTVRDVIRVCAHVKGGVHYGTPKGPQEEGLEHADTVLVALGEPASTLSMRSICSVALKALMPLAAALNRG